MFNALPQHEQLAILDPKAAKQQSRTTDDMKSPEPSKAAKENSAQNTVKQDDDGSPATVIICYPRSVNELTMKQHQIKGGRPKKALDPDKLAKVGLFVTT